MPTLLRSYDPGLDAASLNRAEDELSSIPGLLFDARMRPLMGQVDTARAGLIVGHARGLARVDPLIARRVIDLSVTTPTMVADELRAAGNQAFRLAADPLNRLEL